MPVSILGINHKTAPISVRERVAFSPDTISSALAELKDEAQIDEVAIISTCNRMEIVYRSIQTPTENSLIEVDQPSAVLKWLADYHDFPIDDIQPHCYQHDGERAITHLMSVACGLDSMVLGEPQILGQVKDAYGYASHAGTIGLYLNKLFQQTFTLAKQVRTDTQIGESAVSVAYAAVTLAKRIFDDFSKTTALFIGAGETIELAARHLIRQGVVNLYVANRTVERAQTLVDEFNSEKVSVQAHSLTSLPEIIAKADIIISSTASPVPIIGKGLMEKAIVARKHRSMFLVDLAVPRDVEPEVSSLNDIYLYTVDDMQDVIQENLKLRQEAAREAEDIVSLHTQKFINWLNSLSSVSLLKTFRSQIEEIKSDEVQRAVSRLNLNKDQSEKTEKMMIELANRLTKKFMHQPSQSFRKAGEENDHAMLETLADVFGLPNQNKKN